MLKTTINGYKVLIFKTYNGTELYIVDKEGNQVYAQKVGLGTPIQRAKEVIDALVAKEPAANEIRPIGRKLAA